MPKPKRIYLKPRWPWRLRRYPPRRDRPPWPMSRRERLYENRKRKRRTEIPSEYRQVDAEMQTFTFLFCDNCPDSGAKCNACGCPPEYEREFDVHRRYAEARARFHRLTRQERLYERRKRASRRAKEYNTHIRRILLSGHVLRPCTKNRIVVTWKQWSFRARAEARAAPKYRQVHHI